MHLNWMQNQAGIAERDVFARGAGAKTVAEIRQSQLLLKAASTEIGRDSITRPGTQSSFKSLVFLLGCYWNSLLTPMGFFSAERNRLLEWIILPAESSPEATLIINNNTPFNALHTHKFLIQQKKKLHFYEVYYVSFFCCSPFEEYFSFISSRFMIYYRVVGFCGDDFSWNVPGDYCISPHWVLQKIYTLPFVRIINNKF